MLKNSHERRHLHLIVGGGVVLAFGAAVLLYRHVQIQKLFSTPASYEACVAAKDSRIQESYPATCVTAQGKSFTQPMTDEKNQNLSAPLDTGNWKTYTNALLNISFQYPNTWEIQQPKAASSVDPASTVSFAPLGGGNIPAYTVRVTFLVSPYQEVINKYPADYPNQSNVTAGTLKGVHFNADDEGIFVYNKNGKALEFFYAISEEKNYQLEVEQMIQTLSFSQE